MIKVGKNAKILLTLILVVLAFCCALGATSSYFSASASRKGILKFPNLDVGFKILDESYQPIKEGLQTIELYPMSGAIVRGQEVKLSAEDGGSQTVIGTIAICNAETSIEAFVRFWIDAYVVTDSETGAVDKTKNYGEYFILNPTSTENIILGGSAKESATEGSWCYYVNNFMSPENVENAIRSNVYLGNTLELKESVSDAIFTEIVGHQLKISITLEAVQRANGAFRSEFDDEKGYYKLWS